MTLINIFNKCGNFINPGYDPFRVSDKYQEIHDFLFDDDDGLQYGLDVQLHQFINEHKCSWNSDIVRLYWAEQMGINTKGSYPAVYMWR